MVANKAAGENRPEAYSPEYVEDVLRAENEVGGHFQQPLFRYGDELPYPGSKTTRVPTLNIDHAGPMEPADEPFTGGETGDPSCGGTLNVV